MPPMLPPRARTVLARMRQADLSTGAAAVAYNAFLGMVPLTAALVGLAAVVGGDAAAIDRVDRALRPVAPEAFTEFVTGLMSDAAARLGGGGGLWFVILSGLVALFLGSRAVVALQRSLALIEGEVETRPALQMRLVAVVLTVAGGVALLVASLLLVAGRLVFAFLGELFGWEGITVIWAWLRVPVAGAGLFAFLAAFYRVGPPEPLPRPRLAAAVGATGIVVTGLGFGWVLSTAAGLGGTFGTLGAVGVALVWLYLSALSILAGGVLVHALDEEGRTAVRG
jgi:membrane protein